MERVIGRELVPQGGVAGFGSRSDAAFEELPCMALMERDGYIVAWNRLARQIAGEGSARLLRVDHVLLGAYDFSSLKRRTRFDCMMLREGAAPLQVSVAAQPSMYDEEPCHLVLLMERWEGFSGAMDAESSFLEEVLDATPEATVITHEGRVLHVNREFSHLFGYGLSACVGQELDELVMPEGKLHESEMILHTLETSGRAAIDTVRKTATGERVDVAVLASRVRLGGEASGVFVTYRDIRKQKLEEARLQYTAFHDALTGLANRALFLDRVRLTLARLKRRPDRGFAIVFLDLDGFKKINDTLGHAAGDALLLQLAERLTRCVRPQDTVARFGGDEFALLLDDSGTGPDVMQVTERMQAEIRRAVVLNGVEARVAASMGIAMAIDPHAEAEELLQHADTAMYEAKAMGKARQVMFRDQGKS